MALVVIALGVRLEVEPRVGVDRALERRERRRIDELHRRRLVAVALEGRHHQIDVAPDLRLERRIVGGEDSDHLPDDAAELDVAAERDAAEAIDRLASDVDFARSGGEAAPFDKAGFDA